MGIHIRMGDTRMSEELGRVSGADDDQRLQVPLQYYLVHVNSLLQTLSWALRPLDATGLQSKEKPSGPSTGSHVPPGRLSQWFSLQATVRRRWM